jgi:hypothetical protein
VAAQVVVCPVWVVANVVVVTVSVSVTVVFWEPGPLVMSGEVVV